MAKMKMRYGCNSHTVHNSQLTGIVYLFVRCIVLKFHSFKIHEQTILIHFQSNYQCPLFIVYFPFRNWFSKITRKKGALHSPFNAYLFYHLPFMSGLNIRWHGTRTTKNTATKQIKQVTTDKPEYGVHLKKWASRLNNMRK